MNYFFSLLMTKKQRYWLNRLSDNNLWSLDASSAYGDAIVDGMGNSTYLNENAVIIYDKFNRAAVNFSPDWFFIRANTCRRLMLALCDRRIVTSV